MDLYSGIVFATLCFLSVLLGTYVTVCMAKDLKFRNAQVAAQEDSETILVEGRE